MYGKKSLVEKNASLVSITAPRAAATERCDAEGPAICPECGRVHGDAAELEAEHQRVLDRLLSPTVTDRVNARVYRLQLEKLAWILTPGVEKVVCPKCTEALVFEILPIEHSLPEAA